MTLLVVSNGRLADRLETLAAIVRAVPDLIVQVREPALGGRALYALVQQAIATGARVLVNDRLDVALAAGAAGVHLPERGLPIADARALAPGAMIGASRHDVAGAVASAHDGADLVILGPIWDTPGKGPPLGVAALTAARAAMAPGARLCAIGGIDGPARARAALDAGADDVAVIRAVWDAPDPAAAAIALRRA